MKKKFLMAAGTVLCLLAGCKGSEPTNYEKGIENLEKHSYVEAIAEFQDAIQKDDHAAQAWRGIGVSWVGQGSFDKAEEAFVAALELTKASDKAMRADLYLYLADVRYHQNDYQGCVDACDELLEFRKEKDGYFLRGRAYLHMNNYKEANNNFGKMISDSRDYEDYLDIYKVYKECDLNADGVDYLERALEFKPKTPQDFYDRGRVYYYLEEYEHAEKELKKAWKEDYAEAGIYLGKVYMASQDLENAKKIYEKCLDVKELKAEAYNGLAYCAMAEEDYAGALSYVKKGLKLKNPEVNQALLFNEIVIYEKTLDFASAKEKMQVYLEKYPADDAAIRENSFLQTR